MTETFKYVEIGDRMGVKPLATYEKTIEGMVEKTSDTEWSIIVTKNGEGSHDDIANLLLGCLEYLEKGEPRKYRIAIEVE